MSDIITTARNAGSFKTLLTAVEFYQIDKPRIKNVIGENNDK